MQKLIAISLVVFLFISGMIFVFLVPPFQKPDEYAHFERSLMISKGYVFCSQTRRNTITIERKYYDLISDFSLHRIIARREFKLNANDYLKRTFTSAQKGTSQIVIDHLCNFPVVSYLPQALGLLVANAVSLNGYHAFFLGRFVVFLLLFAWMIVLLKKAESSLRIVLFSVFSLPMTIHQLASYSYDGIHLILAFTIFVYLFTLMKKKAVSLASLMFMFGFLLLFIMSKTGGYETFMFLVFLLPIKKTRRRVFFLFMLLVVVYLYSRFGVYRMIVQTPYAYGIDPIRQLQFILFDPSFFITVLAKTTIHSFIFYAQSMIGIFGWLEYGLAYPVYFLLVLFLIYIVASANRSSALRLDNGQLFFLGGLLVVSYVEVLTINYLFWTPYRAPISDGTQGRYFLPFLPFVLVFLMNLKQRFFPKFTATITHQNWVLLAIQLYILFVTIATVINRFYYYR